jgi:membrane fusion protein, multidrug efflux system
MIHLRELIVYGLIAISALFLSCSDNKIDSNISQRDIPNIASEPTFVEVKVLKEKKFEKEIISNGKLKSFRKADLRFRVSGDLEDIFVKNGSIVSANQVLAKLNRFEYEQQFNTAKIAVTNAHLQMEDMTLAYQGLKDKDLPSEVKESIAAKSGYIATTNDLKTAQHNLDGTELKSPFAGKIANLKYHRYERIDLTETFCNLIDDSSLEVEFSLTESELNDVKLNDAITVTPFAINNSIKGYISEINPQIDENGLVLVKGVIKNNGQLLEGMNVKVKVIQEQGYQVTVPKSAVIVRQGQQVVFKYVQGKAVWNYVKTGLENSHEYTLVFSEHEESLHIGDTIIVSGNLNLVHEGNVVIKK